jgi:hypothetical protein
MEKHLISPVRLHGMERDNFIFAYILIFILFYISCMRIINYLKVLVTARIARFNNQNLYVLSKQRNSMTVTVLSTNRNYFFLQH